MPNDQRIDYIELPGSNFEQLETFYSQTFGWTFQDYGPEYRAFNDGGLDGGFYKSDLKSSTAQGAALVILYAVDLEATHAQVLAAGGSICKEIFSFPGGRRFHFLDPHGNELAVWSEK